MGCGPGIDPIIGSYAYQLTGTDTNTAPNTDSSTSSGTGVLVITANAETTGYFLTLAHPDTNSCTLSGTLDSKAMGPEMTVAAMQTCTFKSGSGTITATVTTGRAVLKAGAKKADDTMTFDVSYSYVGNTGFPFNLNFSGNGTRKYAGARK